MVKVNTKTLTILYNYFNHLHNSHLSYAYNQPNNCCELLKCCNYSLAIDCTNIISGIIAINDINYSITIF
jgi:hypothetical protein